jgi:hypothetical protein
MSTATLDLTGLDRLQERFKRIADPDATPLMVSWMRIIDDDNRRGVLAGTDKDGQPMAPVTYRPKKPGAPSVPLTVEQRLGQHPKTKRGRFATFGSSASGANNNLTSAEYRLLDGPALAPRRQFSRVITNLLTDYDDSQRASGQWEAWGYWEGVVSAKGVPFLIYHFDGEGNNPQRDLRGVRPEGRERAKAALRAWAIDMVRTSGDAGAHTPASHPKVAV